VRRAGRLARTASFSLFDADHRRERMRYLRQIHREAGWRGIIDVLIR
jgi:hypothetical protein